MKIYAGVADGSVVIFKRNQGKNTNMLDILLQLLYKLCFVVVVVILCFFFGPFRSLSIFLN